MIYSNEAKRLYVKNAPVSIASNGLIRLLIVYMYIFICRPFEEYQILSNLRIELFYVALMIIYIVYKGYSFEKLADINGMKPVFILFSIILLSGLVANDTASWSVTVDKYYKIIIFYLLLVGYVKSERDIISIIIAYVGITALYEALCLKEYFIFGRHEYRMGISRLIGLGSSFADPNAVAASINYSLPFAYSLSISRYGLFLSKYIRTMLIIYFIMSPVCIILTGSRSGAVCFAICLLLMVFRAKQKFKYIVLLIVFVCVGWSMVPQEKISRIKTLYDDDAGPSNAKYSADSRKRGFTDGLLFLRESPLLGVGAGNFADARVRRGLEDGALQAHNLYGQTMGELGALGVVAFLFLLVSVARMNLEVISSQSPILREFSWACIFSVIIMLINGYGSHNLYRFNWLWITAFSGILLKLCKNSNNCQVGQESKNNTYFNFRKLPSEKVEHQTHVS